MLWSIRVLVGQEEVEEDNQEEEDEQEGSRGDASGY